LTRSRWLIAVLITIGAFGGGLLIKQTSNPGARMLGLAALVAVVCIGIWTVKSGQRRSDIIPSEGGLPTTSDSRILEYGRPQRRTRGRGGTLGIIISSFIAGMLFTVGLIVLLIGGICGGWFR
jgi:hypothetical protein